MIHQIISEYSHANDIIINLWLNNDDFIILNVEEIGLIYFQFDCECNFFTSNTQVLTAKMKLNANKTYLIVLIPHDCIFENSHNFRKIQTHKKLSLQFPSKTDSIWWNALATTQEIKK